MESAVLNATAPMSSSKGISLYEWGGADILATVIGRLVLEVALLFPDAHCTE